MFLKDYLEQKFKGGFSFYSVKGAHLSTGENGYFQEREMWLLLQQQEALLCL